MNLAHRLIVSATFSLLLLVGIPVFAQTGPATTTATSTQNASSTPPVTVESILLELYGTTTPGLPDYLKTIELPTENDLPELPSQYKEVPLIIEMKPEIPGPNENVSVKLESYSTDLNRNEITWILNGKVIKKGVGQKNISFKTGAIGTSQSLTVIVNVSGFETVKRITIGPAAVDLIWQAGSYVPPFYKGKALFGHQGVIKIVAIPNLVRSNGARLPANSLVYKWKKDQEIVEGVSGYGKSSVIFNDRLPVDPTLITVEVSSMDGTIKGLGSVVIESVTPEIILYEDRPLTGVYHEKMLSSPLSLVDIETKIVAEPYFFSTADRDSGLDFSWFLNNVPILGPQGSGMVFRREEGKTGQSIVSVEVANKQKMFQNQNASLLVKFESKKNSDNPSF